MFHLQFTLFDFGSRSVGFFGGTTGLLGGTGGGAPLPAGSTFLPLVVAGNIVPVAFAVGGAALEIEFVLT